MRWVRILRWGAFSGCEVGSHANRVAPFGPTPFGLSLSKPLVADTRPFGLRYRSLVLLSRISCSLREAAPGFRPGSRPPFLYRQERRQRSDPCLLGPRGARAALRCSVFAAAPNSLRSLRSLRSDKRREVSSRSALARAPQSPALLSSSEGGDEHQIRLASHRRQGSATPSRPMRSEVGQGKFAKRTTELLLGPVGGVEERRGLGPRAQHASSTDFARLSERSGRRPRSEFCARPQTPSTAEQSGPSRTASVGSPFLW